MPKSSESYSFFANRWVQLALGLIAMMAISSPQYVWTLFVKPFQQTTGASLPQIQFTFSLLIVLQTWFSPVQGWLIEKFGVRALVTLGVALSGLGWVLSANVESLTMLYLTYGLFCGIGTGIVYVGIIGLMALWFPNRRGFAIGVVAAGYGMGAMITTFPIDTMLHESGYRATLMYFGCILGFIGMAAAIFLRKPKLDEVEAEVKNLAQIQDRDIEPFAMLKTPIFWLMFVMMTLMSTGGLMVTSNFASFASDFGVSKTLIFGMAALPLALTIDRLMNGFTRPFFGWVSDHIGRENTMGLAFAFEALAILLLIIFRENTLAFVLLSGLVLFGWGEIFSLFPSTLTDTFGSKHATTNYGLIYMAQGVGSLLGGPVAAWLHDLSGSWIPVFTIVIVFDVLTAILALLVLKRMRQSYLMGEDFPSTMEVKAA